MDGPMKGRLLARQLIPPSSPFYEVTVGQNGLCFSEIALLDMEYRGFGSLLGEFAPFSPENYPHQQWLLMGYVLKSSFSGNRLPYGRKYEVSWPSLYVHHRETPRDNLLGFSDSIEPTPWQEALSYWKQKVEAKEAKKVKNREHAAARNLMHETIADG